jgi:hypothetical protein
MQLSCYVYWFCIDRKAQIKTLMHRVWTHTARSTSLRTNTYICIYVLATMCTWWPNRSIWYQHFMLLWNKTHDYMMQAMTYIPNTDGTVVYMQREACMHACMHAYIVNFRRCSVYFLTAWLRWMSIVVWSPTSTTCVCIEYVVDRSLGPRQDCYYWSSIIVLAHIIHLFVLSTPSANTDMC